MTVFTLFAVGIAAAAVPIVITATHPYLGTYGWHPNMDTLAHFAAGIAIGAGAELVWGGPWLTVLAAFGLAGLWEFVEPRFEWVSHTGYQDTEADIMTVTLAAALVALAV